MILLSQFCQLHKDSTEWHRSHITVTEYIAVEDSKLWKSRLICTTWLVGYVTVTLTSNISNGLSLFRFLNRFVGEESK